MIVLDTSLLSVAYRRPRRTESLPRSVQRFRDLIADDAPMAIPGVVLQELLSGLKTLEGFRRVEDILSGFPLLLARRETHVEGARIRTRCRAKGIVASTVDCLIAAHAIEAGGELFTLDEDFTAIARHCGLKLFRS